MPQMWTWVGESLDTLRAISDDRLALVSELRERRVSVGLENLPSDSPVSDEALGMLINRLKENARIAFDSNSAWIKQIDSLPSAWEQLRSEREEPVKVIAMTQKSVARSEPGDVDEAMDLLIERGISYKRAIVEKIQKLPHIREIIWEMPDFLRRRKLNQDILTNLIRGTCRFEGRESFGSTTPIPRLLKMIDSDDLQSEGGLIDWLFSNRTNPYIPLGGDVPLGINSMEEYREYEKNRADHRSKMRAADQENSEAETARKIKNVTDHAERKRKMEAYRKRFKEMSDAELIAEFESQKKNPGWVSSRAFHDAALRREMIFRKLNTGKDDITSIE